MDYEKWIFHDVAPVYLQLYDKLKYGILSGEIGTGDRIPSAREMAKCAKV